MTDTSPNIWNSNCGFPPLQVQVLKNSFARAGGTDEIDTLNLGKSGTAGTMYVFPTTASKGKIKLSATDNTADYQIAITNAAFGQAATLTIPDPGAATAKFALDGYTNVFTATQQINTLNIGASGAVGSLNLFSTTASKGKWNFAPVDNTGNTTMTITNAAQAGAYTYTIPNAGASASFVMTQGTQTLTGNKTFATGVTFGASSTITGDIGTGTCSSNAVTISNMAGTITTESLTTAGGANQAITVTNTLVSATSVVLAVIAGGSNTNTWNIQLKTVPGSGSFVTTIYNNTAATALNGTIIIKFLVIG